MYNNLSTLKGKGTSGYIQSSKINQNIKKKREHVGSEYYTTKPKRSEYKDTVLLEHELRRKIEVNIREFIEKNFSELSPQEKKLKLIEKRQEITHLINQQKDNYKEHKDNHKRNISRELEILQSIATSTSLQNKEIKK